MDKPLRLLTLVLSVLTLPSIAFGFGALAVSEKDHSLLIASVNSATQAIAEAQAIKGCKAYAMEHNIIGDPKCHIVERFHKTVLCILTNRRLKVGVWSSGHDESQAIEFATEKMRPLVPSLSNGTVEALNACYPDTRD